MTKAATSAKPLKHRHVVPVRTAPLLAGQLAAAVVVKQPAVADHAADVKLRLAADADHVAVVRRHAKPLRRHVVVAVPPQLVQEVLVLHRFLTVAFTFRTLSLSKFL